MNATRLLVRGVNWLGDAVMTTPALRRLRECFPAVHIALLTHEKLRDLWLAAPASGDDGEEPPVVNEVLTFATGEGLFAIGRRLREKNFDLALVLPNSPRSALEVWLARIPQRVGYARPWRNWFLTTAVPTRPGHAPMRKRSVGEITRLIAAPAGLTPDSRLQTPDLPAHQIHEYLHLAAALGANPEPLPPRLTVSPAEVLAAGRKFRLATGARPIFGLNPGAEYGPAKRWPTERFIAAAQEIQRRTNCLWLILGGKNDTELAATIATGLTHHASRITPPVNLAGQTSLRELLALLSHCRVLLTNDSGPMHVAAALGVPVVVPFGSTSPELTGPGLPGDPRHRRLQSAAPCAPCFHRVCPIDLRCLRGISIERVVQAVLEARLPAPVSGSEAESPP